MQKGESMESNRACFSTGRDINEILVEIIEAILQKDEEDNEERGRDNKE